MELGEVSGVYALMPTPAVPAGDDWRTVNSVDVDEAVRGADALASFGVDAIMGTGTTGECAALTKEELLCFARGVVEGAAGRCPVYLGPTAGGTKATIERGRALAEAGVTGFLLGRPMWNVLEDFELVEYYRSVAEALPEMAIVIYDNPVAFGGPISTDAYRMLAEIPQVVAAKLTLEGSQVARDVSLRDVVGDRLVLMPPDAEWLSAYRQDPGRAPACWSSAAAAGPAPLVALRDALRRRDFELAETITREIHDYRELTYPRGDSSELARNPVGVIKRMVTTSGFMNAGPSRPPHHRPQSYVVEAGARAGRHWAAMHARYAASADRADELR